MSTKVQAVFFDLGDTLTRTRQEIVANICKVIGNNRNKPLEQIEYLTTFQSEWKKRQKPLDKELIKSVISPKDEVFYWNNFFVSLLTNLDVHTDRKAIAKNLAIIHSDARSFECFDDVHTVLADFKTRGLKLGMISNAFPSALEIINLLNLRQYFDYVLLSYEFKYIKPEPEIYRFAVKALNVDLENSIFIDDRWAFVKAALQLGMDAYLIDRIAPIKKDIKTSSFVPRVSDLFDLRNRILMSNKQPDQIPFFLENNRLRDSSPLWTAAISA